MGKYSKECTVSRKVQKVGLRVGRRAARRHRGDSNLQGNAGRYSSGGRLESGL